MKRLAIAIAMATALSTCLLAIAPAYATPPGENGPIVFRQYFNRFHRWGALFSIDPDGTGERQITHPPKRGLDNEPDVSPDGHWIVYERWRNHRAVIFRVRLNGRHRKNLTGATCPRTLSTNELHCIFDAMPSWSPNGRRIAFARVFDPGGRYDIYEMRADGTHVREITDPGDRYQDQGPQWSPDGKRFVFFRYDEIRDSDALFLVHRDGTHLRQLTRWHLHAAFNPDWSPNGRWILFTAHSGEQTPNLWMIHPNGTGLHRLTNTVGDVAWLSSSFSPDGMMIVTSRTPGFGDAGNADVYVMNVDGTGLTNITTSGRWDSAPDWGPQRR